MTGKAPVRDHGGGLDGAVACFGGTRADWIDLSTGINPCPWPVSRVVLPDMAWNALPDRAALCALEDAARDLWQVPEGMGVLAAPGASALIARIPGLARAGRVHVPQPTYNEHAAAFAGHGWMVCADAAGPVEARVIVHPNNPDGRWYGAGDLVGAPLVVVDESFCDVAPARSLLPHLPREGGIVLKSFGKFWGLAGLRLGFAIGDPALLAPLAEGMGPWAVSGPALAIGAAALADRNWAEATRTRLAADAVRLDGLMRGAGAQVAGGTDLFRLYTVDDAEAWQARLAGARIWSRIFPWSRTLIRLGLPAPERWARVEGAL
ncbi:MAG: aminotransferase class I/II-fold pyridoxal phosphate-dependent enzyme [Rhodobacterales bacterium]|nr:aminotransferase class I/II-fold pyridoxal phosphate-dependent enzyme [Rhodobacterales bacterium]